jgi:hypothetical protein
MSLDVLPILARDSLGTMLTAAEARPVREWSPKAVDVGIAHCHQGLEAIRAARQEYGERLHAGMDAKAFVVEIEPLVMVLRSYSAAASRLAEEFRSPTVEPRLREFQEAFQTMAMEAADLLGFLETALKAARIPRHPTDWEAVRRVEDKFANGETQVYRE